MYRNTSFFIFLDVSYTKTQRVRLSYLPAHLTLVGCYGSEKKLIDCAHHDYTSPTSMDISISCISSWSRNERVNSTITSNINMDSSSSEEFNSLSAASLFIAIICIFVVIILVVLLIIFLKRSRKHAQR